MSTNINHIKAKKNNNRTSFYNVDNCRAYKFDKNGNWVPMEPFLASTQSFSVKGITGDFDGDGRSEIAVHLIKNKFLVMDYNTSEKAWQHLKSSTHNDETYDFFVGDENTGIGKITSGDYDGDGCDEIAIESGNNIWIMDYSPENQSWCCFHHFFCPYCIPYGIRILVSGDFDGDGRAEIAIGRHSDSSSRSNDFWTMDFNPETKKWEHMCPSAFQIINADFDCSTTKIGANRAAVGDFDGDGRDEIAISKLVGGTVGNDFWVVDWDVTNKVWNHTNPAAMDIIDADFDLSAESISAGCFVTGDFDGNGRDEIAIQKNKKNSVGNDFWVVGLDPMTGQWNDKGGFDCSGTKKYALSAVSGDFDGDGKDEIIIAQNGGNKYWAMDYKPELGYLDHMNPGSASAVDADFYTTGGNGAMICGDFDGDGRCEICL